MKSLIRWSTTLGLVGATLIGTLSTFNPRALALPEQQVIERLRPVPVFTLTDSQGAPLVATPNEGQDRTPVAGVFISRQDAQAFLDQLKTKNPQAAQGVQVVPVSLAEVYQLAQRARNDQRNRVEFSFIPVQQQVQAAQTILQQSGQNPQQFSGVPLFVAKSSQQNGGYLTIRQNNQEVIPMFFNREELQSVLDRLKQVQPDLAAKMAIQVVNLESLIQTLRTSNNQELTQIMLVPPADTVQYIRSLQQGSGQGNQRPSGQSNQRPSAPAQAPAQNQQRPQR